MRPYYERGGVTIYHGRCEDVLPGVDPSNVGLLLTDPPYGIAVNTSFADAGRQSRNNYSPVHGDNAAFDPSHLLRYAPAVLFGANYYADKLPASGGWIVWDRLDGLWSDKREQGFNDQSDAELAWTTRPGAVRTYRQRWIGFQRGSETGTAMHPTQKPVGMMRWIIEGWTKPGDLVLDPYMGSGPVAQACHETGRRYIGVEVEERYCAAAVRRLAQGNLFHTEAA